MSEREGTETFSEPAVLRGSGDADEHSLPDDAREHRLELAFTAIADGLERAGYEIREPEADDTAGGTLDTE